jgi:hypothetical protein
VATENYIPADGDAVMGYSRAAMIDLLKLLGGLLVGLCRSRAAREAAQPRIDLADQYRPAVVGDQKLDLEAAQQAATGAVDRETPAADELPERGRERGGTGSHDQGAAVRPAVLRALSNHGRSDRWLLHARDLSVLGMAMSMPRLVSAAIQ